MSNVVLLVGCFALGIVARRFSGLPPDANRPLNLWVLYVSMPALVIRLVHAVELKGQLVGAVIGIWLLFFMPAALALWWARRAPLPGERNAFAGAMALCLGLGNTAFVGYPLVGMLGGTKALGSAAVVDQLGTFVMASFGAVPLATYLGGRRVSVALLLKRLMTFPPIVALAIALTTRSLEFSPVLDEVLERLASMLTPLALASVGFQFQLSTLRGNGRFVGVGLAYKLVAAPALMLVLLRMMHGSGDAEVERVAVAQAGMSPMVTAGVLASEFKLDAKLAAALIAVGTPLCMLTVPLWWWLLS